MPYATLQDLIDRFGEDELIALTDRADPPAGAIDAEVVAAALASADAQIDGYVGSRYDLPLTATPPLLNDLACDLARYRLFKDIPTEVVIKNHDDAMKTLRDIAAGRASLDIGGSEPAAAGDGPRISAPDRIFTSDTLKGF